MLKTSPQLTGTLLATNIDNSKVISSSSRNDRKSAKADFIKPMYRVEEPSFLTFDTRQAFTQLKQAFTKVPILQYFDLKHHIQIETDTFCYAISGVLSQMTS